MLVSNVLGVDISFDLALHGRIPMILDSVVRSSRKLLRNLGPSIPQLTMTGEDYSIFVLRPRILVDVGIEMVVPPLATLLSDTTCIS